MYVIISFTFCEELWTLSVYLNFVPVVIFTLDIVMSCKMWLLSFQCQWYLKSTVLFMYLFELFITDKVYPQLYCTAKDIVYINVFIIVGHRSFLNKNRLYKTYLLIGLYEVVNKWLNQCCFLCHKWSLIWTHLDVLVA